MSKLLIEPWAISTKSPINDFCESVFFVGNGYLGMRGFAGWQNKEKPHEHVMFRAGLFSRISHHITDMVQLPDVTMLIPDGEPMSIIDQRLDLYTGVVTYLWETDRAKIKMERTLSMADNQLILVRLTVSAKTAGHLNIHALADARVKNLPVHDDQMIESKDLVSLLVCDKLTPDKLEMHTLAEGTPVCLTWKIISNRPCSRTDPVAENTVDTRLEADLKPGDNWVVEKRIRVLVKSETARKETDDPWEDSKKAWAKLWHACDVEITADDEEMQGALRYNIFQLLCNQARGDGDISIGARGLTHGRYKGNTFWDTEIFMLPFFLWTRPEAAKDLLQYRVNRLKEAKILAQEQNLAGARYPWMCAALGTEQCESWDIGLCEVHITSDIAYAIDRYVTVSGDQSFLKESGAEVLKQTGLYWPSRLTWEDDKGQYSSFFVKGPDEYCGAAVNNTYTNWMARHNMALALRFGDLDASQTETLTHARDHVAILYDEARQLYLQDELLQRLEPAPFLKQDDAPSYKQVCFDRMQRYRVIKQADLVLLMTMFPGAFTHKQKSNVFCEYEPITLHDSTLSWGIHALLAIRLGMWEKALSYLHKAVYLDLKDLMRNTGHEGLHLAAMGAAWQAIIYGAAGLWADEDGLSVKPMLPPGIHSLSFRVMHGGEKSRISIDGSGHRINKEAG